MERNHCNKWMDGSQEGMGTVEVIMILVVLVALVLIFKDVIVRYVKTLLQGIESQTSTFDPTAIAK